MIDAFLAFLGFSPDQWWILLILPAGFMGIVFLAFVLTPDDLGGLDL